MLTEIAIPIAASSTIARAPKPLAPAGGFLISKLLTKFFKRVCFATELQYVVRTFRAGTEGDGYEVQKQTFMLVALVATLFLPMQTADAMAPTNDPPGTSTSVIPADGTYTVTTMAGIPPVLVTFEILISNSSWPHMGVMPGSSMEPGLWRVPYQSAKYFRKLLWFPPAAPYWATWSFKADGTVVVHTAPDTADGSGVWTSAGGGTYK